MLKIAAPRFLKLFFSLLAIFCGGIAYATPNVAQIINSSAASIVNVQAIQLFKIDVPDQYKQVTQDPVYQVFSRIFSDSDTPTATTPNATPTIKNQTQGSGFIIAANGVIVTNYHTIVDANEIYVQLSDKQRLKATVMRIEPKHDLAILKINSEHLSALPFAKSISEGEWVLAIGANKNGASSGSVINSPTDNNTQDLVTDVDINASNTGGPLLNIKGEVLAMNSSLLKAPLGLTRHVLINRLVKSKDMSIPLSQNWAQLGFSTINVDEKIQKALNLDDATGVWIKSVAPNSIASRAGLQKNDVIIYLESQRVIDISDLRTLRDYLSKNNEVNLTVLRNGENKLIKISPSKKMSPLNQENLFTWQKLGLKVRPMTPVQKTITGATSGVEVTAVQTVANDAGLEVGDFLLNINKQDIKSVEQLNQMAQHLNFGDTVFVYVVRGSIRQFVGISVAQ